MKKLMAALVATTAMAAPAMAQDITELRIGILGGENAQDRLNNNECLRVYTEEALGVPAKLVGADPLGRGAPPTGPANKALAEEGGYDYFGMEHVGHLLQIEKPDACRDVLLSFLKEQGLLS